MERLPEATHPYPPIPSPALEAAPVEGRGDFPVILSLLTIPTETQAPSRLAVLCREVVGGRVSGRAGDWHQAYRLSLAISTSVLSAIRFPGDRMLALPLFAGVDPRANAKQEEIP